ncbi:MAG TPA: polyphenol oxidase family protein [Acidimicrobiales bacterium]|nr:polyphenol oxidase family protein [Acidimicrobiales bacterium]
MTTSSTFRRSCASGPVLDGAAVLWTGRTEGDMAAAPDRLTPPPVERLPGLAGRPVAWLHQVHGDGVVVVSPEHPARGRGEDGDALVTAGPAALTVLTADCAPVALSSSEGVVAAVHAGWRGLVAGVVGAAVEAMRALGATRVQAAIGPCIHSECYEFGAAELQRVVDRLGSGVRSETPDGRPALDLPGAVGAALDDAGATLVHTSADCSACAADRFFSHRARGGLQRQAMVVWKP